MTTKRNYCNDNKLHEKILEGVGILTDYVGSTLGPRGRNVILKEAGKNPFITKDGVTISHFVAFEDFFKNAGAQIVKQASLQTNEKVGDGTTTSIVLAGAMLEEAQKFLKSGVAPIEMKRGMELATKEIVNYLEENAQAVEDLDDIKHIATISANNDKTIGSLIAAALDQAGKDGSITIEEARSAETSLDTVEGFIFEGGYASPQFITDERRKVTRHEDCLIFVTDHKLSSVDEMLPILELAARSSRPLLIVADEIEGQFLAALIVNVVRGTMKVVAVKAPSYGEERREILSDLAISTGAEFITRESGVSLRDVKLKSFGKAKTIEVSRNRTVVAGGNASLEKVEKQIESLKTQIKEEESDRVNEKLQERITRLVSAVAIIRVGGTTEVEMIEKKHRVEDALEAVRTAQLGGIHAGGGVPLVRASKIIKPPEELSTEQRIGFNIVLKAIREPVRRMAINAGKSADIVENMVVSAQDNHGYDFASGELVDMTEAGIIDPAMVTCCALQNATSVISTLITTNHAIIESE